jgi:hypothetical protein
MTGFLEQVRQDPRVESAYKDSDGVWIGLKAGFADLKDDPWQPTHTIHEWTVADARARFKDVGPCACESCKKEAQR